jgi:uncharacterized phage protein gp47/JayE
MTTLADLITPQTQASIFQTMLGQYQLQGFLVQSWQPFGVERTRLMAFSAALASVSGTYIPQAAAGGFLDYAAPAWLQLTAAELYNIAYNVATATQGNITATAVTGTGAYSIPAGQLIVVFGASGRRYMNTAAVTILAGPSTTVIPVTAEFTGAAYNDPSSSGAITLATPLPGVTLTNVAGNYSVVTVLGSGTGGITISGVPIGPHNVVVRADTTGAAAVVSWSYSIDGSPFVSVGVTASAAIGATGIVVALADGATPTSFTAGMTLSFSSPGTWVTSQGADQESPVALAQRCRNRWSSLSPIPTNSLYQLLATSTPTVGAQVTQVVVVPDSVINNQVNIVIAGPAGALPASIIAAVQSYINPRVPITDKPVVVSPSSFAITLAGLVTVSASQRVAAQNAILVAITNYVAGIGINGTLRISALVEQIMLVPGVVDVSGVTINGVAANVTLGSSTTFVLPAQPTLALSYVTTSP